MVSGSPRVRPCGDPDRVDVADQVADAGVRGGELLAVPHRRGAARRPAGRRRASAASRREAGRERVYGCSFSSEPAITGVHSSSSADQRADQPGLALAALAEQHHVVAGEQRPLDLGQHGVVVADDAGEARLAGAQPGQQVVAQLLLDGAVHVAGGAQLAEGAGQVGRGNGQNRGSSSHL